MMLYSSNESTGTCKNNAALTIAQLIMFNSKVTSTHSMNSRHNLSQETLLPLYLRVLIHSKTRKRSLVDTLFELGLCISYDRVLEISSLQGEQLCAYYNSIKAVCPPNLSSGEFTLSALITLTTTQAQLHRKAHSMDQEFPYFKTEMVI